MRDRLCTLVLLWLVGACSANENANHGVRCDQEGELCAASEICYRGFCVVGPQPVGDVDAATAMSTIDSAVVSVDEGGSPVDTNGGGPGVLASSDATVQQGPAVPSGLANDASTTPVPSLGDASSAPPVADAGHAPPAPAVDPTAQSVGQAELLVCLASCAATRSPICLACVGGVLMRNPTVCNQAARNKDPTLNGLCAIACTTQLCRGEQ